MNQSFGSQAFDEKRYGKFLTSLAVSVFPSEIFQLILIKKKAVQYPVERLVNRQRNSIFRCPKNLRNQIHKSKGKK